MSADSLCKGFKFTYARTHVYPASHAVGAYAALDMSADCSHCCCCCVCMYCLQGRVEVYPDTGELKLLVKINAKSQGGAGKKSKAVKDLKQLSGEGGALASGYVCGGGFALLGG